MKWNSILALLSASLLILVASILNHAKSDLISFKWAPNNNVVEMPIVRDQSPEISLSRHSFEPKAQRDSKFVDLLSCSLKITVNGASGSGTICYYDAEENWAYIISCGHLWSGNHKYNPNSKMKARVTTWYKNKTKLDEPASYEAEILFWSNDRGYDVSCLRFKPDWKPKYYPIAPVDFKIKEKERLNSMGCDGGREVARYEVEYIEMRGLDLVTRLNSPRPGRSGGGLITDTSWYVGICWGTSDTTSGNGTGYFTPLKSIHKVFKDNDHEWLVKTNEFIGRDIPIYDWENPSNKFKWDYIPIPLTEELKKVNWDLVPAPAGTRF